MQIWQDYYTKLDMEVPQGELGINPGIMSLSSKINIIHDFAKKNFNGIKYE